jgi:hypothetical protein
MVFYCYGCENVLTKIVTIEDRDTHHIESRGGRLECKYVKDHLQDNDDIPPHIRHNIVDAEITDAFEVYMTIFGCPHKKLIDGWR